MKNSFDQENGGDALLSLVSQWRADADENELRAREADSIGIAQATLTHDLRMKMLSQHADQLEAALAARQPMREPVAVVSQETYNDNGTSDIIKPALPIGTPLYTAPPARAAVPVDQFRDADHLAEWLGSLVAACGQEEWDAAQAAMNGVRAFQNHPDAVERLRAAIEGECDGLAISDQQASAILAYVILPEPDGFFRQ